jgi:hypothetical protein
MIAPILLNPAATPFRPSCRLAAGSTSIQNLFDGKKAPKREFRSLDEPLDACLEQPSPPCNNAVSELLQGCWSLSSHPVENI